MNNRIMNGVRGVVDSPEKGGQSILVTVSELAEGGCYE